MKTLATFAAQARCQAVLVCSTALLLTACGGAADPMEGQLTAAHTVVADGRANANSPASLGVAMPGAGNSAGAAPATTAHGSGAVVPTAAPAPVAVDASPAAAGPTPAATANFDLNGYDSQQQEADAALAPQ